MKQHITKEQWDELGRPEQDIYVEFFFDKYGLTYWPAYPVQTHKIINIGQMIEFLGDNFWFIASEFEKGCEVILKGKDGEKVFLVLDESVLSLDRLDYLCDALWEAVKYKLKHD